ETDPMINKNSSPPCPTMLDQQQIRWQVGFFVDSPFQTGRRQPFRPAGFVEHLHQLVSLGRLDLRSDCYANHRLGFRSRRNSKRSSSSTLKVRATAQNTEQPSCQFPNEWITAARRVCIIGGIQNYVTNMLRAQKF